MSELTFDELMTGRTTGAGMARATDSGTVDQRAGILGAQGFYGQIAGRNLRSRE
jgi:hypothetical protein